MMNLLYPQEAAADSGNVFSEMVPYGVRPQTAEEFTIGSIWELAGQAGGFQWPIFLVLVVGLLVLARAFVRLSFDRQASLGMRWLSLPDLDVLSLREAVSQSKDSVYARLATGMLEQWSAGADPSALQQEAAHIAQRAGAPFARLDRVITFLSSTAGGLGLLGTLVGIYVLFAGGSRDPQTIFAGMGIAVISTLLGIIVSIVLELLEVLVGGSASRYHDDALAWASDVRYRLIELRPAGAGEPLAILSTSNGHGRAVDLFEDVGLTLSKIGTVPSLVRPGQDVGPLGVRVEAGQGPVEGIPVNLRVVAGLGHFGSGTGNTEVVTNEQGIAAFTLTTGEEEGLNLVEAEVEDRQVRFAITTRNA